jgi:hypothetical protein
MRGSFASNSVTLGQIDLPALAPKVFVHDGANVLFGRQMIELGCLFGGDGDFLLVVLVTPVLVVVVVVVR